MLDCIENSTEIDISIRKSRSFAYSAIHFFSNYKQFTYKKDFGSNKQKKSFTYIQNADKEKFKVGNNGPVQSVQSLQLVHEVYSM